MAGNDKYERQVRLLIRVLPLVAAEKCFALKGGTAINLFVRDLLRLSVDIDLVYLPMDERGTALENIRAALTRIADAIQKALPGSRIQKSFEQQSDALRLVVRDQDVQIKIELSPVLRGTVFPEEVREVSESVEEKFGYAEMQLVSFADLYAGKICAALDRQHPRDLFDIKYLLENEGLSNDLMKTFLVYLISHNRTMAELLRPVRKNIQPLYEGEFLNMTQKPVKLSDLEDAREKLVAAITSTMTDKQKEFLLSFKVRKPQWDLLDVAGAKNLPAVRWKLHNLERMPDDKHNAALEALKEVLGSGH